MAERESKTASRTKDVEETRRRREPREPVLEKVWAHEVEPSPFAAVLESPMDEPHLEGHVALLSDPRLSHRANGGQKARIVTQLQQSYGNAYVQRVVGRIHAKLTVNPPDDEYEREADRAAEEVMRMPESQLKRQPEEGEMLVQTRSLVEQIAPSVQRQAEDEEMEEPLEEPEEEEEEPIQARLVAEPMTPPVQRQIEPEEEEEAALQTKILSQPLSPLIQRQIEPEEEEEEEPVRTKQVSGGMPEVTPELESRIQASRGGGQALDAKVRAQMESAFGVDFSALRVHTSAKAENIAAALGARALTTGKDVFFGKGQYRPTAAEGRKLLAHELTHVMQQRSAIQRSPVSPYTREQLNAFYRLLDNPALADLRDRHHIFSIYEKTAGDMSLSQLVAWLNETERFTGRRGRSVKYHVLTPQAGRTIERFYPDLRRLASAPVYARDRFYSLLHMRREYATIAEHARYYQSLLTEAERREHAEEQVRQAEDRLRPLFGRHWPRVRDLILRRLPATVDLLAVNWKVKLLEPTVQVRRDVTTYMRRIHIGTLSLPTFQISRVKAETGFLINRGPNRTTWEVDLLQNTLSVAGGGLKLEAVGNVDYSTQAGPFAAGVKTSIFNPLSSGVSWKLGYETKGSPVGRPGGYTMQPYLEFCLEGDLRTNARVRLAALYVAGVVALAYVGAALAEGAVAVGLAARGVALLVRLAQALVPAAAGAAATGAAATAR